MFQLNISALCGAVLTILLSFPSLSDAAMGDMLIPSDRKATLYAHPTLKADKVANISRKQSAIELEKTGAWVLVAVEKTGIQGWARVSALKPIGSKPYKKTTTNNKKSSKTNFHYSKAHVSKGAKTSFIRNRNFNLFSIGLKEGIIFENSGGNSKIIYFPSPLDSNVTSGEFTLRYKASATTLNRSNIRISINDIPMLVHKAATDGVVHQVSVLLPPSLFRKRGLVKVSIKSNLLESSDRCVDAREGSAFIHVLPESSLYLSYDPGIHSVRDFWRMLPQNVTISLPSGTLTPEIFKAAWSMMSMLEKSGKTTKLVHFPELGHITIASKTMLHDQIKTNLVSKGKVADFAKIHYPGLNKDANISLVSYKNHHLLAINEPFDTSPFYLLNDQWNTLAAGQHYRLFPLAYTSYLSKMRLPEASVGQQYSIPVEKIGINTKVQKMFRSTSWSTTVGPYDLPPDSYMSQLKLNVISPISDKRDRDYELYVYINNILLRSMRMKNTGTMQSFDIQLPKDYQIQFNQLSIVAEHDIEQGDCRGLSPTDPFQILPSSKVILSKQSSAPNNFFDLTYYFANGFDTYIEKDYLKDADSLLHLMTRVSVDYPLLADMNRVRFVDGGSTLMPSKPFWAVGDFDLSNITAPMRFDNGRVNVVDNANNTIMDIDQLAKVTTMQIARSGDVSGLLIHPDHQHNFAFPEALHLQRDDIAFLDNNGIILSLDSSKQTQIRVFYPDISTWFDVFDAYRFWFFALGWFLLSFAILYLFRQMKRHRAARNGG